LRKSTRLNLPSYEIDLIINMSSSYSKNVIEIKLKWISNKISFRSY